MFEGRAGLYLCMHCLKNMHAEKADQEEAKWFLYILCCSKRLNYISLFTCMYIIYSTAIIGGYFERCMWLPRYIT